MAQASPRRTTVKCFVSSPNSTETTFKEEVVWSSSVCHAIGTHTLQYVCLYLSIAGGSGLGLWISRQIVALHNVSCSGSSS